MKNARLVHLALLAGLASLPGTASALDLRPAAVEAGRQVFASHCGGCHALKYLGQTASLPAEAARAAFGAVPPDLSLIAAARGRGASGADYLARLLTSYNDTPQRNSLFPGIAMPSPISPDDPALGEKSRQVAAFLYEAAFPEFRTRRALGPYVLAYTGFLTALLYLLYRSVWKGVSHSLSSRRSGNPEA